MALRNLTSAGSGPDVGGPRGRSGPTEALEGQPAEGNRRWPGDSRADP